METRKDSVADVCVLRQGIKQASKDIALRCAKQAASPPPTNKYGITLDLCVTASRLPANKDTVQIFV